jgi:hypothetical protein
MSGGSNGTQSCLAQRHRGFRCCLAPTTRRPCVFPLLRLEDWKNWNRWFEAAGVTDLSRTARF